MTTKKDKFREIDAVQLRGAINGLSRGFVWQDSREGQVYWSRISRRLSSILKASQGSSQRRGSE